ncbi:hypothetical protein [Leptolyngbya sp. PCC 6406]|uniref:hypothetical protein n=1 Tax=Leptolyngbya sp. PCC 6406 TaxID=1173264 RepID=UPI0002ACC008|nr:hypothetical protein [Leptolyngbya sp. PCC 6406]
MSASHPHPALDDFLEKMSPHVTATFTGSQLEAMEKALENRRWQRHPVDLRLSIPFIWKRFYIVVVAGEERRSPDRLRKAQAITPLWTPGNLIVLCTITGMGMLAVLAVILLAQLDWRSLARQNPYPAGIPFKENQENCEASERIWQDGECIDYEHDPAF